MRTHVDERQLFIGAAIAAEDMQVFDELRSHVYSGPAGCILIGRRERCELYRDLLLRRYGKGFSGEIVDDAEAIAGFTVAGATAVGRLVMENRRV